MGELGRRYGEGDREGALRERRRNLYGGHTRVKQHVKETWGSGKMEADIKGGRPLVEIIQPQIDRSRRNKSFSFKADTQSKRNKQLVLLRAREWE